MMGWHAYFADRVYDFMVLRDRNPWELYYREGEMPMPIYGFPPIKGMVTIGEEEGWLPVETDGRKLQNYFKRYAKPETWKKVSRKFYETHETAMICDGPSLDIRFTNSSGKIKEMGYALNEFPEAWHPSYQKACRLMRYLERLTATPRKTFAAYFSSRY